MSTIKICADRIRAGEIKSFTAIANCIGITDMAELLGVGKKRIIQLCREPGKMRLEEFFTLEKALGVGRGKLLEVVEPGD